MEPSAYTGQLSHVSHSQIDEYARCPHRYYLSRIMKLGNEVSPAMIYGRSLHEGIATIARCQMENMVDFDSVFEVCGH